MSGDVREMVVVEGELGGERGGVEGPGSGEECGLGDKEEEGECFWWWWWRWYLVEGRGGVEGGGRVRGGVWGEGRGDLQARDRHLVWRRTINATCVGYF